MRTIYVICLASLLQTCVCHHESEERNKLFNSYRNVNNVRREKRLTNKERFNNAFVNDDWYVFDVVEDDTVVSSTVSTLVMPSSNELPEPRTTTSRLPFPRAVARRLPPCEEACNLRTTSEYNPVCGSNGVTYNNNARLDCASFCGQSVQLQHIGRCGSILPFP